MEEKNYIILLKHPTVKQENKTLIARRMLQSFSWCKKLTFQCLHWHWQEQ